MFFIRDWKDVVGAVFAIGSLCKHCKTCLRDKLFVSAPPQIISSPKAQCPPTHTHTAFITDAEL